MTLPDVQAAPDQRGVALDEVGVSGIKHPVAVADRDQGKQNTVAELSMSVALPPQIKGAHLSRFVELLHEQGGELTPASVITAARTLRQRLESDAATLSATYTHFRSRTAPVSGATGLLDYAVTLSGRSALDGERLSLTVRVPVTSVCPCSKAISDYGAHNQRGYLTVTVEPCQQGDGTFATVWVEELIDIAEASASSPVYPILKRSDERHVTMAGYDHPVFVEDMVREVALHLRDDNRVQAWDVEAVNDESIHNHGAFARVRGGLADQECRS